MWSLLHKFITTKTDGPDSTLVKPSNWNDEHDFQVSQSCLLGSNTGAGPVAEIPLTGLAFGFTGMIAPCANIVIPGGWLLCDGASYNTGDYSNLYAAIGTTYNLGGDTAGTFRVPDLRGRVVAGMDLMTGSTMPNAGRISAQVPSATLGGAGGQQSYPSGIGVSVSGGTSGGLTVSVGGTLGGAASANATAGGGSGAGPMCGDQAPVTVSGNMSGGTSGSLGVNASGGTNAFSTTQPTICLNMVIKT